jgi:hypothetical protein
MRKQGRQKQLRSGDEGEDSGGGDKRRATPRRRRRRPQAGRGDLVPGW